MNEKEAEELVAEIERLIVECIHRQVNYSLGSIHRVQVRRDALKAVLLRVLK